ARLRQFATELDLTRAAPLDELRPAERDELPFGVGPWPRLLLEYDERLHSLALRGVGHADHAGLQNLRMPVEDGLDLRRKDVEARRLDHALEAIAEVEEAVRIHAAEIAGVQPDAAVTMAAQGAARRLGIVEVADHDVGARDADLALLPGRKILQGFGAADLNEHVG